MIGLYSYSRQVFNYLNRLPIWNSQNCSMSPLAFVAGLLKGHWWGFIRWNYVVWPSFFLMNVFIALTGSHFWFLFTRWFNLLGLTVPEKSVAKNFNVWKLERKKNEEIKGQISSSSLIPLYTIHLPTVHVCTKFKSSRPHSSWEKCDKKFQCWKFQCWKLERKKNEEIKGQICSSSLNPVYNIHLPIVRGCINCQSSRTHSSWEKCDEKFQCWT